MLKLLWCLLSLCVIYSKEECISNEYQNDIFCKNVEEDGEILEEYFRLTNGGSNKINNNLYVTDSNFLTISAFYFPEQITNKLEISNSQIKFVEDNAFSMFYKLKELDLHNNHIRNMSFFDTLPSQIESLNLGSNKIEVVPILDFMRMTELQYLNLSSNQIRNIKSDTFRVLPNFRIVDLSHNFIEYIGSNAFVNYNYDNKNKIYEIDLSFNNIKNIEDNFLGYYFISLLNLSNCHINRDYKLFFQNVYIDKIDLSNNFLTNILFKQRKRSTELILKNSFNTKNLIINFLPSFYSNDPNDPNDLEIKIDLSQSSLNIVPQISTESYKKINLFNLSYTNITEIQPNTISSLIESLDLSHNKIETFSSSPFDNFIKNSLINLKISMFGDFINRPFKKMNNLQHLQITHSRISFSKYFFYGLYNLNKLNVYNVEVSTIEPGAFIGLYKIEWFNDIRLLFQNQTVLEENIFTGLNSLRELNLTNLQIREIEDTGSFNGLVSLRKLILKQNKIEILRNNTFATLKLLEKLDLSFNSISDLDVNSFIGLDSLTYLSLENNLLDYISNIIFKPLHNLLTLNLKHNHVHSLSIETFSTLRQLNVLDLSRNELSQFNGTILFPLKNLKNLDLSRNHLKQIDEYGFVFPTSESLKVDLSQNEWDCEQLSKMISEFHDFMQGWNGPILTIQSDRNYLFCKKHISNICCTDYI